MYNTATPHPATTPERKYSSARGSSSSGQYTYTAAAATAKNPLVRFLQTSRVLVTVTAVCLMAGTVVLLHHSFSSTTSTAPADSADSTGLSSASTLVSQQQHSDQVVASATDTIVLLPLPHPHMRRRLHTNTAAVVALPVDPLLHQQPLSLITLRHEFDAWLDRHHKQYDSQAEHARRFTVWTHNQAATAAKNARHGKCRLTGNAVFGANHFADLTPQEFRETYLHQLAPRQPLQPGDAAAALLSSLPRLLEHPAQHQPRGRRRRRLYNNSCRWYDISCHLRYVFSTYLYGLGGTMEPKYDADSYPTALDWRDYGAVTEVHSQGSCGACWAITATETVESAVFLGTGTLYDLAETEVIMCESESQMCSGGWPQNAFEYIMDHNGLPLASDMSYDADTLLMVSEAVEGTSDELEYVCIYRLMWVSSHDLSFEQC